MGKVEKAHPGITTETGIDMDHSDSTHILPAGTSLGPKRAGKGGPGSSCMSRADGRIQVGEQ